MDPSCHTRLVYWSINLPIQMYVILHARKWHIKNHRYPTIYPEGICFPKKKHKRSFTAINWIPPNIIPFLYYGDEKRFDQSYCPHLAKKDISAKLTNFTTIINATTNWEWKSSTSKYPHHTSTSSEGGTGFSTSAGANALVRTHTTYKRSVGNTPQVGSTSKFMD